MYDDLNGITSDVTSEILKFLDDFNNLRFSTEYVSKFSIYMLMNSSPKEFKTATDFALYFSDLALKIVKHLKHFSDILDELFQHISKHLIVSKFVFGDGTGPVQFKQEIIMLFSCVSRLIALDTYYRISIINSKDNQSLREAMKPKISQMCSNVYLIKFLP
ncbi:hypothetical protein LMG7974_01938 [Campylobacter majalis]|uniref:Uncharacterized protein n=1 Tax=Campylobacter majalis TaxID=2790656 RepID=A0ABN7KCR0_9BACT|nr:hypothetical protein [Campylobacter majalis]CAD7289852.1 hypothetical protein LMG7974_01938 [Campylobacter majalis]